MIKLNNKNITYVALADTNNSIKAPKEIWYADSSNSVKLVYRRKDALIEGEDYEKYHWLVGDADAYINTLKYYRPYDDSVQMTFRDNLYPNRVNKYNKYNQEEQIWGACESNNLQSVLIRSYVSGGEVSGGGTNRFCNNIINGSTSESAVSWGTYAIPTYINESPEHSLYISSVNNEDRYYFIYNGNTKNNLPTRYTLPELVQQDVCIFYSGIHDNGYFNGSFFNFIHYRNNVEITHLIPCKLLKPVPKWLDANGIRRQVGECGMIDLVSGKFYGNVNNVGTFTVENYYERKEWLVGDGSAYINTTHNTNEVLEYETSVSNLTFGKCLFWFRIGGHAENKSVMIVVTDNTTYKGLRVANVSSEVRLSQFESDNVVVSTDSNSIYINGIQYPCIKSDDASMAIRLFYSQFTDSATSDSVKCAYFRLLSNGSIIQNLIPCTLTMDLPASMDANNIARTKGTSGMWDLVSDRFYGNVANSGTFKAVNLAEGVDYEVHQWLVGDGNATVKVIGNIYRDTFSLVTIPTTTTNKRLLTSMGTTYDGNTTEYQIMVGGASEFTIRHGIRINNRPTSIIKDFSGNYINNEYEITTYRDGDYYYGNINGVEYKNDMNFGEYQFDDKDIVINIYSNGFKLGNFNSGRVDLIPVKLLRSISSKYDANGIARQAGECGMYDTVNDVFYGNVASSGMFSVSDDS